MSAFFAFLAEHLAATMTALVTFLAGLAAITQAARGKFRNLKGGYVAAGVFVMIFLMSAGYLAGQYSVLSTGLTDGDGQMDDTQMVSPDEDGQAEPQEDDEHDGSREPEGAASENTPASSADAAEGQGQTRPVSGQSGAVPQESTGDRGQSGAPADTAAAAPDNSSAVSNGNTGDSSVSADNGSAAASNGGVVSTGDGNTTIHNSGDNNNIITGDGNKIEIHGGNTEVPVTVSSVFLNKEELTLEAGSSQTLTATVLYSDNEQGFSVKWVSSDEDVATVDQRGRVTAVLPGSAKITAQASKNNTSEKAECLVMVTKPATAPTGYSISLSTKRTSLYSEFTVRITPYEDDVTRITVHAAAPSGQEDVFVWGKGVREKNYYIDTETGTWKIWATVENEEGVYTAGREEDFATIEITPVSLSPLLPDNILS